MFPCLDAGANLQQISQPGKCQPMAQRAKQSGVPAPCQADGRGAGTTQPPGTSVSPSCTLRKCPQRTKRDIWGKKRTGRKPETWLSQALPRHGRMCSFLVLQPGNYSICGSAPPRGDNTKWTSNLPTGIIKGCSLASHNKTEMFYNNYVMNRTSAIQRGKPFPTHSSHGSLLPQHHIARNSDTGAQGHPTKGTFAS